MRYEEWTSREAEVRLGERAELRAARRLVRVPQVPDHTTVCRFLRRVDEAALQRALGEAARPLSPPRGGSTVAVDATGPAPRAVSTYFVNRARASARGGPAVRPPHRRPV